MRPFCPAPGWWPGQERGSPGKLLTEASHPALLQDWCFSNRSEMKIQRDRAASQPEWVTQFPFSKICIEWVRGVGRKLERPGGGVEWYKKQDPRQQPAMPATPAESPHPSHPPGGTNQTFSSRQKNKHDMNRQSKPQQAPGCRCSFPQGPMVPNSSQPALDGRQDSRSPAPIPPVTSPISEGSGHKVGKLYTQNPKVALGIFPQPSMTT